MNLIKLKQSPCVLSTPGIRKWALAWCYSMVDESLPALFWASELSSEFFIKFFGDFDPVSMLSRISLFS
jgi:hypothetical protein